MTVLRRRLRQRMKELGYNQETLAAAIGKRQPYVHKLLSGKNEFPRDDSLTLLANALRVDFETMVRWRSGIDTAEEVDDDVEVPRYRSVSEDGVGYDERGGTVRVPRTFLERARRPDCCYVIPVTNDALSHRGICCGDWCLLEELDADEVVDSGTIVSVNDGSGFRLLVWITGMTETPHGRFVARWGFLD